MSKIPDVFSKVKEKLKNTNKIVIIIIAVLLIILIALLVVFFLIGNKNKEKLSAEQVNAYLEALEETSASFEDIEQIEQGLLVYEMSDEYGRTLNEDEKNHLINVMGYDTNKKSESSFLNTFKVYTPAELVEAGIIISEEFVEIYGEETYYISIVREGSGKKNIIVVLKEPRTIGTEEVYSKPEEEIAYEQIIQEGEEVQEEEKIPTIVVTKSHNTKAKVQLSYSKEIVEQMKYSLILEDESKEYVEGFYVEQNQLISTKYKQKGEEQEKEGNSMIVSSLKLLSPTYKIEQVPIPQESLPAETNINNQTTETQETQTNLQEGEAPQAPQEVTTPQTVPTLVFGKVEGEAYEGEIKYQYRLEIVDENGYVVSEEEGENDRYELTQNKVYNFFVNAKPVDENINIQESDTVLIKINGSEIVQEQKSNDTTLKENIQIDVLNKSRKNNRYTIFRIR